MGSSDPLPAGFVIRFGRLNFQATGNSYLMHITNCDELRARRPPSHPLLTPRRPLRWMLRALQRLDAVDAPASARDRRGRSQDKTSVISY
jgi:hypothetical protein